MPQHVKRASPPVCLTPSDLSLHSALEEARSAKYNTSSTNINALLCTESDSESLPNSQGSTSSQMFEFIQSSQSSNDSDEESGGYQNCPDLSHFVSKVTKNAPEHAYFAAPICSATPTKQTLKNGVQLEITPTKSATELELDPLTPTANLKMLISAASPEIRHREKLRELQRNEEDKLSKDLCSKVSSQRTEKVVAKETEGATVSRKEKSLGLLCQRFLARYPKNPGPLEREEICLDEVAKDLMVERRRIYDIVNVLESVEMMSRVAKNRYTWHGRSSLRDTLLNLKLIGEREGFADQIEQIRRYEEGRELGERVVSGSPRRKGPLMTNDDSNLQKNSAFKDYFRKDKSLGIMSQKFLMLFLVSKNKPINLDLAAKILIGDPSIDLTENAKFKTKIRRLYDIANILTSLDLIRKVHLTEVKGRKPAFKYIGPAMEEIKLSPVDGSQRPTSRHSLLECIQVPQAATSSDSSSDATTDSSTISMVSQRLPLRKPLSRHSSFDQICEVAEQERNRLYFESNSQPSSPVKPKPKSKRALLQKTKSMPPVLKKTNDQGNSTASPVPAPLKHFVMIRSTKKSSKSEELSDKNVAVTIQKLPIQNVLAPGETSTAKPEAREKVLVKAQLLQQTKGKGSGGECQPRLVKVSKDQLDTVLKSLQQGKLPAGLSTTVAITTDQQPGSAPSVRPPPKIHMVRMSQPLAQPGMLTPSTEGVVRVPARKRPAKEALPQVGSDCYFNSKRPRIGEFESGKASPPDREVSQLIEDKSRPSPRALHLDPQFQPSPPGQGEKTPSPELPVVNMARQQSDDILASPLMTTQRTPRESTPDENICGTFRMSTSSSAQQVFHIPNTSSPVMLVPTPGNPHTLTIHPQSGQLTPVSTPVSFTTAASTSTASRMASTPLSSSPKKLHLGASGIGALHPSGQRVPNPSLLRTHQMVSPVPIHVSPVTLGPGGLPMRSVQGIRPSSNAIINLIPHLTGGSASSTSVKISPQPVSDPIQQYSMHNTMGAQSAQSLVDPLVNTSSSVLLTPREDAHSTQPELLTPTYTTTTPSQTLGPLTPSTYFRSTPGGIYQLTTVPHVVTLGHNLSAFQPLRPSAARPMPTAATARRLTLVEGENLV